MSHTADGVKSINTSNDSQILGPKIIDASNFDVIVAKHLHTKKYILSDKIKLYFVYHSIDFKLPTQGESKYEVNYLHGHY